MAFPHCTKAKRGWANCSCAGGFLMSWTDEYWKGAKAQAACTPTIRSARFTPLKCQEKAHVTCGNWDTADHDLCGYWLEAAPDHYVNEEWFGITSPSQCAFAVDALRPRAIFWTMRKAWTGEGEDSSLFDTCDDMLEGHCLALGDGGRSRGPLGWLLGAKKPPAEDDEPHECSGRGTCTSQWQKCGAGGADATATPCCSCLFGYAGPGCSELDVRMYVAMSGAGVLALLLLVMVGSSIGTAIAERMRPAPTYAEPLPLGSANAYTEFSMTEYGR